MKNKTFFISDTHFCHVKLAEVRGFRSVTDHDEYIISNWNSVVGVNDTIWHLGDAFLDAELSDIARILPQLNGKKKIVLGNHDSPRKIRLYIELFDRVCAYHEIKSKDGDILLSHMPVHRSCLNRGDINIHGHKHNKSLWSNKYINVSCENVDYTPRTLDELKGCQIWKKIRRMF